MARNLRALGKQGRADKQVSGEGDEDYLAAGHDSGPDSRRTNARIILPQPDIARVSWGKKRRGAEPLPEEIRSRTPLEIDLDSHLDFTRRIDLTLNVPEAARVKGCSNVTELRVVESIEGFHPEFQARAFTHLVQWDLLEQRESGALGSGQTYVRLHSWCIANGVVGRH